MCPRVCPSSALNRDFWKSGWNSNSHWSWWRAKDQAFFPGYLLCSSWFQKVWEMVNEFTNDFSLLVCKVTFLSITEDK